MSIIKDIMYVTEHSCLLTVDNENFLASTNIVIFNNDNLVKTVRISDIGYKKNLDSTIKNPIVLIVRGISKEEIDNKIISEGMIVESEASSPLLKEYNFKKKENLLRKLGVSIHDEQGNFKSFKDILDDIAKAWRNLDNTKEDKDLKDYITRELVGAETKAEFKIYTDNKIEKEE